MEVSQKWLLLLLLLLSVRSTTQQRSSSRHRKESRASSPVNSLTCLQRFAAIRSEATRSQGRRALIIVIMELSLAHGGGGGAHTAHCTLDRSGEAYKMRVCLCVIKVQKPLTIIIMLLLLHGFAAPTRSIHCGAPLQQRQQSAGRPASVCVSNN